MTKERFSIRKTSRGAVSARIALISFLALAGTGLTVQAEETSSAPIAETTVVTDEQVDQAAAEVAEATRVANETQEAADNQKVVADQAQEDANQAQEAVNAATVALESTVTAVQDAQTQQVDADAQVVAKSIAAEDAYNSATAATEAVAVKEAEVNANLEHLQAAADAEAVSATNTVTTNHVHTAQEDIFENDNGTEEKQPMTFAEGRVDVNIYLTPEQVAQVQATGTYDYVPNDAAITQYAVDYINAIKRINGIPGEMHADEAFIRLAKARADESKENGFFAHRTNLRITDYIDISKARGGENGSTLKNVNAYYSGNPTAIMSDQAMAYHLVLRYFHDYNNVLDGYGHALTMLTKTSGMGIGVSAIDVNEFETYGQTVRTGGDGYATMSFSATREEQSQMRPARDSFAVVTGEDGRTKLTYEGRDLVFLPRTYFHYVYTTNTGVATTEARDALNNYRATAFAELDQLRTDAATKNAIANALANDLSDARNTALVAAAEVSRLIAEAEAAQARLFAANATLSERTAILTEAVTLLDQLRGANIEAQATKAAVLARHAELLGAQRTARLAAEYAAIVARGNVAIPNFDTDGTVIGYTEELPAQPQPEAPKPEAPKPTTPPVAAPQPEAPKPEAPKPTTPPVAAPQPEAPQPEAPKPTTPPVAAPQPEAPKPEAPQPTTPPVTDPQPEAPQPEAPKATDAVALSQTRNQFLALLDKSGLTDDQKGELAIRATFAESLQDLVAVVGRFEALTASVVAPAPAVETKPAAKPVSQDVTKQALMASPSTSPAKAAAPTTVPSRKTLPATGDTRSHLFLVGAGLLTLGLVPAKRRR